MNKIKQIISYFKKILINIRSEHIGAFAAQSSFFIIMSFFPLAFLIISLLKLSGDGVNNFTKVIANIVPYIDRDFLEQIFDDFVFKPTSVISFSTLLTAWSAGKSFYALSEGFRSVLNIKNSKNYFVLRIRSLVFSVAFALSVAVLFFAGVFGDNIHNLVTLNYPNYYGYTYLISGIRKLFMVFILFIILSLLYIFLPDWEAYREITGKKCRIRYHFVCAFLASFIIYSYTIIFSVFADVYVRYNDIYGSISAFISVMLWLYGSMYILILGLRLSVFLNDKKEKDNINIFYLKK